MTQVPMNLTFGQGQQSRSNFPKNGLKTKELFISRRLFHLQTSYLVPSYNPIRCIQWPKCRWSWPLVKVNSQGQISPKMGKKNQRTVHILEAISPTYLLWQLFVTHLGVALLLYFRVGLPAYFSNHSPFMWELIFIDFYVRVSFLVHRYPSWLH